MTQENEAEKVAEKIVSGGWTNADDYGDITDEEWTCLRLDIAEALTTARLEGIREGLRIAKDICLRTETWEGREVCARRIEAKLQELNGGAK